MKILGEKRLLLLRLQKEQGIGIEAFVGENFRGEKIIAFTVTERTR